MFVASHSCVKDCLHLLGIASFRRLLGGGYMKERTIKSLIYHFRYSYVEKVIDVFVPAGFEEMREPLAQNIYNLIVRSL